MRPIASTLASAALLLSGAPALAAQPAFVPDANLERAKIPAGFQWKLAPLFPDDAAWEKGMQQAAADRAALAALKGKLSDPARLREALDLYFKGRLLANKLTLYAHLRRVTDQKQNAFQAMDSRALKDYNAFQSATSFIRQEVLALDDQAMAAAYAKEPKLAEYKTYLDELRRRRSRLLGAEAERVLSLAGDNLWAELDLNELPSDFEKVADAALSDMPLPKITDEAGKPVQLTLSNYPKYRSSPDRRVRKEAVQALLGTLRQYQNVFAGTLGGQINFNIFLARARGYDTALAAYMDKDNIDTAVYKNLVSAVRANVAPLHRYVALRKKILGLPDVHLYDLYTPMVGKVEMKVGYEQARDILPKALAPLGPDYVKTLTAGLDPVNGWVDIYPNKDKESGAFCSSVYGLHPFVKMNYLDDLDSLSTLAHEYGHALHYDLSAKHQPYQTSSYTTFIAEIASTLNEKLLSDYLANGAKTKEEKLYVLNKLVESIRTTIYRQTLFAEFELAAHTAAEQGTPLTAEFLNKTYRDLVSHYYGKDFTIDADDETEWAYIPHFYYKYYVYAYATGLSSGIALAEKVQKGDAKARDAYLTMLGGGCSKPPLELLKNAGLDLTKPEAVEAAAKLMDRTITEMEKLLK